MSFQSFLAAVDEGCHVCKGLFRQAPEEWKQELRRRVEISQSSAEEWHTANGRQKGLTTYTRLVAHDSRYGYFSLALRQINWIADASWNRLEDTDDPYLVLYPVAAGTLNWTITSPTTNSEETFAKIRAWLGKCGNTHEKCRLRRNQTDVGWQPTRLVGIAPGPGIGEDTDRMKCRVVELKSENIPQDLDYITLSHRWPQDQRGFQKLTLDNLPLWKASLPVNMLRQTFRDTFLVAQKLGICYVWIDSLCIIQDGDDYADWRKEAPEMHKVYSNAEFNICASKNNQDEGLFSLRGPSDPQPLQLGFFENDDGYKYRDSGCYLIRKESPVDIDQTWDARMKDSPLASRGWVFQEQLFSHANVHFGNQEIFFECLEMRASESFGSQQDYEVYWASSRTFFKSHLPIPAVMKVASVFSYESRDSDHGFGGNHYDYKHWHDVLTLYTTLEFTKSDDRLVALSGVAQYFKNCFSHDDCYIAGLWYSRLKNEMLWQMTEASSLEKWETRKKTSRHLTFSWASVQGQVENKADVYDKTDFFINLADLEPIKYRMATEAMDAAEGEGQPFAEDMFSLAPIPTVEIRITGFLRPMILKKTTHRWRIWPGTRDWTSAEESGCIDGGKAVPFLDGQTRLDFEMTSSELNALNTSGRFFLMPLKGIYEITAWLLLLELVEAGDGKDMGRFRRIGVHENENFWSLDKWLTMRVFSDDLLSKLPCWRYDSSSKQHTIFVI